jgi:outer membrane protein assembly factor BamB
MRLTGKTESEAAMIFDERGIYVLSKSGATGFTLDGRRLWYTTLENAAAIPSFGDDGVLYSGGQDWILYTYKLEDRMLPSRQSIYGPEPDGTYGTGNPSPSALSGNFPPFSDVELRNRINNISIAVMAGRVGVNEIAWTAWLMGVADRSAGTNPEIRHRVNALRLLGRIGSRETIPWLTRFFRRETDSAVKAAAAGAIGAIGVDPDGIAIRAFYDYITFSDMPGDEQVLSAVAAATGALCRFSGPPLSDTGIRILTLLSGSSLPAVRRLAGLELASMRI